MGGWHGFCNSKFSKSPLQFHKKSVYLCLLCNANKNRHLTKRSQQCNKPTRQHPWIFSKNQKIYKIKDKLSSSLLFIKMTFLRKIFFFILLLNKNYEQTSQKPSISICKIGNACLLSIICYKPSISNLSYFMKSRKTCLN